MDRLASMAAFVKAAEIGSFAGAGLALGISPQMVAKHVEHLEHRIGTRLINRTTRRQGLTEIGQTYFERCKAVLAEADWADALAEDARAEPRGRLRVNAPVSFGSKRVAPMVARYLRDNPGVEIDLVLSDRFVDLIEDGFEAIFRIGPLADSSAAARPLAPFRQIACASPKYLRDRGMPSSLADLQQHDCLAYSHWPEQVSNHWQFVRNGLVEEVERGHSRLRANSAAALVAAALEGFGIAMLAEDLVHEALATGQLVRILEGYEVPTRPMHLLFHADRRQTSKLRSRCSRVCHQLETEHHLPDRTLTM